LSSAAPLLAALLFAARRHRDQRRKGTEGAPYVNHLIEVAEILARVGGIEDPALLQAAVLHDTLEDTDTTAEELEERFGSEVLALVREMTDDERLPKAERKRLQIVHAPNLSPGAKQIKIADKISNLRGIAQEPPSGWALQRRLDYLEWTREVVAGCRGANAELERLYDAEAERVGAVLRGEGEAGTETSAER
jgi:guanosine-3',5'-bis(diphosphate) 3'-pyrophosphohydrolase